LRAGPRVPRHAQVACCVLARRLSKSSCRYFVAHPRLAGSSQTLCAHRAARAPRNRPRECWAAQHTTCDAEEWHGCTWTCTWTWLGMIVRHDCMATAARPGSAVDSSCRDGGRGPDSTLSRAAPPARSAVCRSCSWRRRGGCRCSRCRRRGCRPRRTRRFPSSASRRRHSSPSTLE